MGQGVRDELRFVRVDDLATAILADGSRLGRLDWQAVWLDRRAGTGFVCFSVLTLNSIFLGDWHGFGLERGISNLDGILRRVLVWKT